MDWGDWGDYSESPARGEPGELPQRPAEVSGNNLGFLVTMLTVAALTGASIVGGWSLLGALAAVAPESVHPGSAALVFKLALKAAPLLLLLLWGYLISFVRFLGPPGVLGTLLGAVCGAIACVALA